MAEVSLKKMLVLKLVKKLFTNFIVFIIRFQLNFVVRLFRKQKDFVLFLKFLQKNTLCVVMSVIYTSFINSFGLFTYCNVDEHNIK